MTWRRKGAALLLCAAAAAFAGSESALPFVLARPSTAPTRRWTVDGLNSACALLGKHFYPSGALKTRVRRRMSQAEEDAGKNPSSDVVLVSFPVQFLLSENVAPFMQNSDLPRRLKNVEGGLLVSLLPLPVQAADGVDWNVISTILVIIFGVFALLVACAAPYNIYFLTTFDAKVDKLDAKVNKVDAKVDKVMQKLDGMEARLGNKIKQAVNAGLKAR